MEVFDRLGDRSGLATATIISLDVDLDDPECPNDEPSLLERIDRAAASRGHRVLTPQGEVVERSLGVYIADGGDLALVPVMATAPGGCTHVDELDELTPPELDHLHAGLSTLMRDGSIPQG